MLVHKYYNFFRILLLLSAEITIPLKCSNSRNYAEEYGNQVTA